MKPRRIPDKRAMTRMVDFSAIEHRMNEFKDRYVEWKTSEEPGMRLRDEALSLLQANERFDRHGCAILIF